MATQNPTIKQLEAFVLAAKLGSFQAAAHRLHTTQSAIAKRIGELESQFELTLFDRTSRKPKLTIDGNRMVSQAEDVLAATTKLVSCMSAPGLLHGTFRFGATELVAITWLPALISRMRIEHPGVKLTADINVGTDLLQKLESGQLDAVVTPGPLWKQLFTSHEIGSVEIGWMASPSMSFPEKPTGLHEMNRLPMLEHSAQGIAAQMQSAWLRKHGFAAQSQVSTNNLHLMAELTMRGLGVSRLPVNYFRSEVASGLLRRLETTPALPDQKYFVVHRPETASALLDAFLEHARACCDFSRRDRDPSDYSEPCDKEPAKTWPSTAS